MHLKKVNKNGSTSGFTIVEVLMFLAISAAMFTIAFYGTRRTQDNVAFRSSLDATEQKLREVFNNVDNGYFSNAGEYTCSHSGISLGSGGGDSKNCVFLGKQINFNNSSSMIIKTLIVKRVVDTDTNTEQAVDPINTDTYPAFTDIYNYEGSVVSAVDNSSISVRATKNPNVDDTTKTADTRSSRQLTTDGVHWNDITTANQPLICFELGNRHGGIIVTQKDLIVKYTLDAGDTCS